MTTALGEIVCFLGLGFLSCKTKELDSVHKVSLLYPSIYQWTFRWLYIYMMEYYSAMKRNKIGSFVET